LISFPVVGLGAGRLPYKNATDVPGKLRRFSRFSSQACKEISFRFSRMRIPKPAPH